MKLGTLLIGLSLVLPCATAGSRAETAPAAKADECRKGHVISGPIEHVRDADIIRVGDVSIRLQGIVTPGLTEPNGIDAAVVVTAAEAQPRASSDALGWGCARPR